MDKIICIILGGGRGQGLYPLTKERTKAAVPFGGKYRLVDVALSNCIHAGLRKAVILTRFNTPSLHTHIAETYTFDRFSRGVVKILSTEHTIQPNPAHEGSADALRKALDHLRDLDPTHYLIIQADALFRMDLGQLIDLHKHSGADVTLAGKPLTAEQLGPQGILRCTPQGQVLGIDRLPGNSEAQLMPPGLHPGPQKEGENILGFTGISLFKASVLHESLKNGKPDLTWDVLPDLLPRTKTNAYVFTGYWESVGDLKSYYQANLNLTAVRPGFNLYDPVMPIFCRPESLPLSKINFCTISQALFADGCIVSNSSISNSLIGPRTIIDSGANLDGVVVLGADRFETPEEKDRHRREGLPCMGIGKGTIIRKAIIDKDARIGEGCRIGLDRDYKADWDNGNYFVREGIVVIPKGAIIPSGTVI